MCSKDHFQIIGKGNILFASLMVGHITDPYETPFLPLSIRTSFCRINYSLNSLLESLEMFHFFNYKLEINAVFIKTRRFCIIL